jgi:hypothetical protein
MLWPCLDDAATALDAHIGSPEPQRPVVDLLPSRASTPLPPRVVDGTAAPLACPADPVAGEGRDRPSGASGPPAAGPASGGGV